MAIEPKPWRPFLYAGTTYDLGHLDPRTITFVVPAKGNKLALVYTVDVTFGTNCFTRGIRLDEPHDRALEYRDGREVRVFDFRRFALSKTIPNVVHTLIGRKCMHGNRLNFFTVAATDERGTVVDYDIFFTVSKSSKKGRLNLFIQSAYVGATLPAPRPIRFEIILYNTLNQRAFR